MPVRNFQSFTSIVEEDAELSARFPASSRSSSDHIPRRPLLEPASRPSKVRAKSVDERLQEAQAAYEKIMRSLSPSPETSENSPEAKTSNGNSVNARLTISLPKHMPNLVLPQISKEDIRRSGNKDRNSGDAQRSSGNSAGMVDALKQAMRPIRLLHPSWAVVHITPQNNPKDFSLEESPEEESPRVMSSSKSENASMDTKSTADPRSIINELWEGRSLTYSNGVAAAPKYRKIEKKEKNDARIVKANKEKLIRMEERRIVQDADISSLLPEIKIISHRKKPDSKNATEKAERNTVLENGDEGSNKKTNRNDKNVDGATEAVLHSRKARSVSSGRRTTAEETIDESDDNSSRTWNVSSPKGSVWTDIDSSADKTRSSEDKKSEKSVKAPSVKPRSSSVCIKHAKSAKQDIKAVEKKFRGRSLERYKQELIEKESSDFAEMRKQFRANPVPAFVYDQKYEKLQQEEELRKWRVQERAREMLQEVQPFEFVEIPDRHISEKRKRLYADQTLAPKIRSRSPRRSSNLAEGDGMAETNGHIPFGYTLPRTGKTCRHAHLPREPSFRPKINPNVPDFNRLHNQLEKRQEAYKQEKSWTTVQQPFSLSIHNHKLDQGSQSSPRSHKEFLVETKPLRRTKSFNDGESFDSMVRPTKAFSLMAARSRRRLKEEEDERLGKRTQPDPVRAVRLQEKLHERDIELTEAAHILSQQKNQSSTAEDRSREYKEELTEVKRRLDERPFMWERSQMNERKKRIDKRFQEILEDYSVESILNRAVAVSSSS